MDNSEQVDGGQIPLEGVGARLKRAREKADMTLQQVSAETRIQERHLEVIEHGDFDQLPARTYAVGFSRSYARLVGLDEKEVAAEVRAELARGKQDGSDRGAGFEPGDPAKVPSRGLAWFGVFAAVLLIAGGFAFYRAYFAPGMGPAPLQADPPPVQAKAGGAAPSAAGAPAADPTGAVVLTSLEDGMWVRFYDGSEDNVLLEKLMAKGEKFTVPAAASAPMIRTGRPDAFAVTIGGKRVAKLAEDDFVMSGEPISAKALLARSTGPAPAASPAAAPAGAN